MLHRVLSTGERTALRRLRATDLGAFQSYRHDPAVGRYQGWLPMADDAALAFLEEMAAAPPFVPGEWFQIGIAERQGDALIGDIGVCVAADGAEAEIGFTLAAPAQGRGLAREAVRQAMALVFAVTGVQRIVAITDARNTAAIRLLDALGMPCVSSSEALFRGEPCVEHTFVLARPQETPTASRDRASNAVTTPSVRFRPLVAEDQAKLWHWLHIALWDPPPAGLRPIEVLQNPGVRIYAEHWGRETDVGVVAQVEGRDVGACWLRLLPLGVGLASVDEQTPQLGIALDPAVQHQGHGRPLMYALMAAAKQVGYAQISLTVHPENPAQHLYEACGFRKVDRRNAYHLMVARLA